jgi:hypothetical protein
MRLITNVVAFFSLIFLLHNFPYKSFPYLFLSQLTFSGLAISNHALEWLWLSSHIHSFLVFSFPY